MRALVVALVAASTACAPKPARPAAPAVPSASRPAHASSPEWDELARVPELGDLGAVQILPPMLIERRAPYADLPLPAGWLGEAPELGALYFASPKEHFAERWQRVASGFDHTWSVEQWVGSVDGALLESFDTRALAQGFVRGEPERMGQRLVLPYKKPGAEARLRRDAVFELAIDVTLRLDGEPPAGSSVHKALGQRAALASLADALGAKLDHAAASFDAWYFVYALPEPTALPPALAARKFRSSECPMGRMKWERQGPRCWIRDGLVAALARGELILSDERAAFDALGQR